MMLKDKVALVTGASRGIGKAVAIALGAAGAKVAVNYSSSETAALDTVKVIQNSGGIACAFKASVNIEEEVTNMFKSVESTLGATDILVNNAGITKDNLLIRMKTEEWNQVMDVNLTGAFFCTKIAAAAMIKKRYGKIINISSVVGFSGNAGQFNYCATKAGIIGMTKSAAIELGVRGICVNAIAPGFIKTDMTETLPENIKEEYLKKIPLKAFGKPEDVAQVVLFLASPASDYITGQTIHVNGGLYL